ncbi:hypothetical protein [Marinobacter sp. SS21]|uniref:hypothetical protein n=1 Tax=Marinobacter sp. SS21 TaxID=2979460 RepID=UPI002330D69C|nr:hypothetical protein [Marinobacter sp. SS21]MDC0663311.1 hypothetical protein [Marinobacter sp. SS21]
MMLMLMLASPLLPTSSQAAGAAQSFESCSMITSEYLTVLQLMSRGFGRDTLMANLPEISEPAQARVNSLFSMVETDGLTESYSRINAEYSSCAKGVYQARGTPATGSREAHFYFCAGENKVRYEIVMAAVIGADRADVTPQLPPQYRPTVNALFDLHRSEGPLTVFDELASELKKCLIQRP